MRNQVKALIAGHDWPIAVFEQLGGKLEDCPSDGVIERDTALSALGLTIHQAVDKWIARFSASVRELKATQGRSLPGGKQVPDSGNQYVETSTDPFSGATWDKDRHSALIFMEYARYIDREEGIDVYETKAQGEADYSALRRLIAVWRKEKTFADESLLDEVEQELLRESGVLSKEERQTKDELNLAKARALKEDLRESGMSDAPRSGFCKRTGCPNRKVERLLIRGFCPDCRGRSVKQTIPKGNGPVDAAMLGIADATLKDTRTSIRVSAKPKKVHPDVLELTSQERREKVLAARTNNPSASVREIAKLTNVPRSTVNEILKGRSPRQKHL